MGTNYYVVPNRPSVETPIHIGKSSYGWKFLFHEVHDTWNEPPIVWEKYEDVRDWLKKYTVDSKEFIIMDEYDRIVSYDDLMDLVAAKQLTDNPDDFRYNKNVNGYRFEEGEFC